MGIPNEVITMDLNQPLNQAYFKQINTLSLKGQLRIICDRFPAVESIAALESLSKEIRQANSKRINNKQMGRKVDERPDEINMKDEKASD